MEIEKKYLISEMPDLSKYNHKDIIQGYLCTAPVVRVRQDGDSYYMTYKGSGMMVREEYNLPLTKDSFEHLLPKCDGKVINKTRYLIPYEKYTVELDVFHGDHAPLIMAEVEFDSEEEALGFDAPDWFGLEVTNDPAYHNCNMIG